MPVPDGPLLLAPLLLAAVLGLSGVAKGVDPGSTRDAMIALRLPPGLVSSPVPVVLPWAEVALAVAVLVLPGLPALLAVTAALVLLLGYVRVVARALTFGEPVTCRCFGRLGLAAVSARTLLRNVLLVVLATIALVGVADERSVVVRLASAPASTWGWLAMTGLASLVAVLVVGSTDGHDAEGGDELDYRPQPAPYGLLVDATGGEHALHLLARERAQLLLLVSEGCGPCQRVLEDVPEWQRRLPAVAVRPVFTTDLAASLAARPHLRGTALGDVGHRVADTFGVGTPAAVLIGTDGLLAGGPVAGEGDVRSFVDDVAAELRAAGLGPEARS